MAGPVDDSASLDLFHPLIRRWFEDTFAAPTDAQARAWPRIAAGEHVLISAPTGSGKTLTAFLWALDRLLTGAWEGGRVRVLYISPLRALNTDIRRNLEHPLAELEARFRAAGQTAPGVRVMTRSGDTPSSDRQRMLRHPPEILITTPESLNILLTSRGGRSLLGDLETVILDEVHAVASSKRGTHLITAVDRLVPLSGDFQRLAISATVRPFETMSDFVGGYRLERTGGTPVYRKRSVSLVRSTADKAYDVEVRFPLSEDAEEGDDEGVWQALVGDFKRLLRRNRSTLFFANSRRNTERVTRMLNDGERVDLAYSHHGSLSREVRAVVEQRLKAGELRAIVATSSLELGIDVGALDEVALVSTPRSISAAIQRVGRAGHGVGEVSRGSIYPTHGRDLLDAAVVAPSIPQQDIEEVEPVMAPLDVLAQVVLSMVSAESWPVDDLLAQLRTSYPYRQLERAQLDLVLDMLAGRYADSRVRELRPRITFDRVASTLRARPGSARLLYLSGGTIADRGYFNLRIKDSMAKLGELDEEFVWERSIGDRFTLGAQSWQVEKVTHNDVLVSPARGGAGMAPFWRADQQDRGHHLATKTARFLGAVEERLGDPKLLETLVDAHFMAPRAAAELARFLEEQKAATGRLPNRHLLVVERFQRDTSGRPDRRQVALHTLWGGTVNRPFALALSAAWEEQHGESLAVMHNDDSLLLDLPWEVPADELLALVDAAHVESLLRRRLEASGFFGARFRAAAATALLLPRASFRQRVPLWLSRQRSKKLLESVSCYEDFPILVEAWRTCLRDDLDLPSLARRLGELGRGEIVLHEVLTEKPSPFAAELMWQQTNHLMYEDDTPESGRASRLRQDLLQELVFSAHLRPRLPGELVTRFRRKVQRTAPGYAPRNGDELSDWIEERLVIPSSEWAELREALDVDLGRDAATTAVCVAGERAARLSLPRGGGGVVLLDRVPRLFRALGLPAEEAGLEALEPLGAPLGEATAERWRRLTSKPWGPTEGSGDDDSGEVGGLVELAAEWIRFQGPFAPELLAEVFGLDDVQAQAVVGALEESEQAVVDQLTAGSEKDELCDAENLEILLRWMRSAARPSFEPRSAAALPLFAAVHQGLASRGDGVPDLQQRLEQLFGYPAKAQVWEAEILPARLEPYYPAWLDSLMQENDLRWVGLGKERLTFAFAEDLELLREAPDAEAGGGTDTDSVDAEATVETEEERLFAGAPGRYGVDELATRHGESSARLMDSLWRLAWEGKVSNDTFLAVRRGLEGGFGKARPGGRAASRRPPSASRHGARRGRFDRWKASPSHPGSWFLLDAESPSPLDALDREELAKDRARLLLERYGVIFRERVARELPALRWGRVFRALRLMELGGEVLAGYFFKGVRGLQFISHAAFRDLRQGLPEDAIYWQNAADPASLCGIDIEGLKGELPARRPTTHLVFHGHRLVLVSKRHGRELDIRVSAEHPSLEDYFGVFKVLLTREAQPLMSLTLERINDEPAAGSAYCESLGKIFRLNREPPAVRLWKRYG